MENEKLLSVLEGLTNHLYSAGLLSFLFCMGDHELQSTDLSPLEKASIVLDEVKQNMHKWYIGDTMEKFNKLFEILKNKVAEQ